MEETLQNLCYRQFGTTSRWFKRIGYHMLVIETLTNTWAQIFRTHDNDTGVWDLVVLSWDTAKDLETHIMVLEEYIDYVVSFDLLPTQSALVLLNGAPVLRKVHSDIAFSIQNGHGIPEEPMAALKKALGPQHQKILDLETLLRFRTFKAQMQAARQKL